jgi:hypothetical protein
MLKRFIFGTTPVWLRLVVYVAFWMVLVDAMCDHHLDGWTHFKWVFLGGPALAAFSGLCWVASIKPVWVVNKDRRP